jgi:hypothetical protein
MSLTALQCDVCRLFAEHRIAHGERYIAGGVALNVVLGASRRSRDIDVFHDTAEALRSSWDSDRALLLSHGYGVEVVRERPAFIEALVRRSDQTVVVEWSQDSAYRFFPLVEHPVLGLTMHPVDLATNKVLALVGRREVRDFIDVMQAVETVQPLGYLAWAACGKDPGFSPPAVVEEGARSVRYGQAEVDALDFGESPTPNAAVLSARWHAAVNEARLVVLELPAERAGTCVIEATGHLCRAPFTELSGLLKRGALRFHEGSIRGSFPRVEPWHCPPVP